MKMRVGSEAGCRFNFPDSWYGPTPNLLMPIGVLDPNQSATRLARLLTKLSVDGLDSRKLEYNPARMATSVTRLIELRRAQQRPHGFMVTANLKSMGRIGGKDLVATYSNRPGRVSLWLNQPSREVRVITRMDWELQDGVYVPVTEPTEQNRDTSAMSADPKAVVATFDTTHERLTTDSFLPLEMLSARLTPYNTSAL